MNLFIDVNECDRFTPCGASNKCDNLIGSYVCTCGAGYRASPDARACVDEGRNLFVLIKTDKKLFKNLGKVLTDLTMFLQQPL